MSERRLRSDPGTYALFLRAGEQRTIAVGALGEMTVQPGVYVYVGSAFGPGGVQARVHRHARADGALHWHVDYLRAVTTLERVWWTHDETRRECDWASALRAWEASTVPLDGFGASDCACPSHLMRVEAERPASAVCRALQGAGATARLHERNATSLGA